MCISSTLIRRIIWVLLITGASYNSYAQKSEKESVIEILDRLANDHQVTFSFNSLLLENLLVIPPDSEDDLPEALKDLSASAAVRFEEIGNEYYTVVPVRSEITFEVKDKRTGEHIPVVLAQVAEHQMNYLFPQPEKFRIQNVFLTDSVSISSRFYQTFNFSVQQLPALNHLIWLNPDTLYLEDVTVMSYLLSGINADMESQSVVIKASDLGLIAGETDGDILQVLRTIPGIKSPTGKAGALMLRGSTYDQNLLYFDDIPLYHTGHYFGTISPYNQAIVDEVEVYRSNLPLEWGGRVGGLINIQTDAKIPSKISGGVLANTIYSGAHMSVPLVSDKMGLFLSARSNYPSYSSPKMDSFTTLNIQGSKIDENQIGGNSSLDDFEVKFNDINTKLIFKPGDKHEITYSAMRIRNDFNYLFSSSNRNLIETEKSQLDNWGMTAKWVGKLSDKWKASAGATVSVFELTEERKAVESGIENEVVESLNTIEDTRLKVSATYEYDETLTMRGGYELTSQQLNFEEAGTDRGGNLLDKKTNDLARIHSTYMSAKKWLGPSFLLDGGLHLDYYSLTQSWYADPRVMFSYFLSKTFYLKGSAGISHQYLQRQLLNDFDDFRVSNQFWFLADKNLPVQTGMQYMVGAMWDKSGWLVDVELYHKQVKDLTRQGETNNLEFGSLTTIGADVLVKKRFSAVDLWCSYTLGRSTTDFGQTEEAYFDQTHVLNLMFLIPKERWNFSLAWGLMSGMPVRISEDPSQNPTALNVPYQGRFPMQHQLDLSATYQFSKPEAKWRGVIGLSVLNLYNRNNLINIFQSNVNPDAPYRMGVDISPNLQVSISW